MMFYHDHSYGITRLNVYAGEEAPYIIHDAAEKAFESALADAQNPVDATTIPLVIQDKTFVPDETQLAAEDPTWDPKKWGGKGNLWMPHVYMPNQNPYNDNGASPDGPLGLRPVVLAALHRPEEPAGPEPALRRELRPGHQRLRERPEPRLRAGKGAPDERLADDGVVLRHHARQRHAPTRRRPSTARSTGCASSTAATTGT